jgi:ferredoxin/flavodoxin---NADP+ reductase
MLLKVTEVEHYTDTLFRFKTERPSTFRFAAGEFTMIGMGDNDIMRAYSITSGPYDDFLEFYSIKVPDGPLTSRLQKINVGDTVEVGTKPTGTLTLANLELGGNLYLLATGTGIAPFISLLRDPTTYDHFDRIHVAWSVRQQDELLAYNSFLQECDIIYTPIVTRDPEWPFMNKRITNMLSAGMLIPDLDSSKNKVMICGSNEFNSDVKTMLTDWKWEEGSRKTAGTFVQEKAFVS